MGVRRQGEFGVHGGGPVVRRRDFVWSSPAVDASDGVDLGGELVPVGVGLGCGPIRVEGGIADRGEGAGVDGKDVDESVMLLSQLLGEDSGWWTVAALVCGEVLEQHVLGTARQGVEGGRCGLPAVVDRQGDDRMVNDVASTKQEEGGGQQGGGAENGVHHQKLLVKVISKPLEAGTARQTPPMQKMPSRRLPYPMERRWAPSIRPTVPYR